MGKNKLRPVVLILAFFTLMLAIAEVVNMRTISALRAQLSASTASSTQPEQPESPIVNPQAIIDELSGKIQDQERTIEKQKATIASYREKFSQLERTTPVPEPSPTTEPTPQPEPDITQYDNKVSYDQLFRNPEQYAGKNLSFLGEVTYAGDSRPLWGETEYGDSRLYLAVNGNRSDRIEVFYSSESGRVLKGDIIIAAGKIIDADTSTPKLTADFIYFPDRDEIIDSMVDAYYGDSAEKEEFRESLKQWYDAVEDYNE